MLYYSRNAKDRARAGLWVLSLDSGARRQLTASAASSAVYVQPGYLLYRRDLTSAGDTITILFSGDGTRGILGMHSGSASGLWLTRLGSGTAPEPLATKGQAGTAPFAMDWRGNTVLYSALASHDGRVSRSIRTLDLATGEDSALVDTPGNELFSVISPDGRRLAYASDETGQWEVYVATLPKAGERWRVSAKGGHQPRWSRDGAELFYIAPDRQMMSVRVLSGSKGFEWDAPRPLFQTAIVDLGPFRGCWGYAVAPQRFLILTRRPQGPSPAVAVVNWRSGDGRP